MLLYQRVSLFRGQDLQLRGWHYTPARLSGNSCASGSHTMEMRVIPWLLTLPPKTNQVALHPSVGLLQCISTFVDLKKTHGIHFFWLVKRLNSHCWPTAHEILILVASILMGGETPGSAFFASSSARTIWAAVSATSSFAILHWIASRDQGWVPVFWWSLTNSRMYTLTIVAGHCSILMICRWFPFTLYIPVHSPYFHAIFIHGSSIVSPLYPENKGERDK